jgi:hypothetical protein
MNRKDFERLVKFYLKDGLPNHKLIVQDFDERRVEGQETEFPYILLENELLYIPTNKTDGVFVFSDDSKMLEYYWKY